MGYFCGGLFCLLVAMTSLAAGDIPFAVKNGGRWRGAAAGCLAAAAVQSSSAVSCAVCAARQKGDMEDLTARSALIGANVGTTVTPFLTAAGLGLSGRAALVFPLLGTAALLFRKKLPPALSALPSFCLMMWGLSLTATSAPGLLSRLPEGVMPFLFSSPLVSFAGGALLTGLLQSSSVCVGLIQTASLTLPLSRAAVLPMLIGQNVGTASTALFASLGAGKEAGKCARYHLFFNLRGAAWALPLCWCLRPILDGLAGPWFTAVAHLSFNLLNALLHLVFFKE